MYDIPAIVGPPGPTGPTPILMPASQTVTPDISRVEAIAGDWEYQDEKFIFSANSNNFLICYFPTGINISSLLNKTVKVSLKVEEQKSGGQPYIAKYYLELLANTSLSLSSTQSFDNIGEGDVVSFSKLIDAGTLGNRNGELFVFLEINHKDNGTGSSEHKAIISEFTITVGDENEIHWYTWDEVSKTWMDTGVKANGESSKPLIVNVAGMIDGTMDLGMPYDEFKAIMDSGQEVILKHNNSKYNKNSTEYSVLFLFTRHFLASFLYLF